MLKYQLISPQELLNRLQRTRLMGHGQPFIYQQATLTLQEAVDPNRLIPAQRYVLETDFRMIENLYHTFKQQAIDIFALAGGLYFWQENSPTHEEAEPIPLTPPIIEESLTPAGETIWLISDGMHRVYTARQLGKPINIILVQNLPTEYPYYAYPLAKGWSEVIELAELPDGFHKKTYREKNYKELFRDYNEVFPGIQKQRKKVK